MLELTRQKQQEVKEVIEVDQYQFIRHAYAIEGLSQREIARRLGISRNTVKKYIDGSVMPLTVQEPNRSYPVTGPIQELVASYLAEDKQENVLNNNTHPNASLIGYARRSSSPSGKPAKTQNSTG